MPAKCEQQEITHPLQVSIPVGQTKKYRVPKGCPIFFGLLDRPEKMRSKRNGKCERGRLKIKTEAGAEAFCALDRMEATAFP